MPDWHDNSITSRSMRRQMPFRVLLPVGYASWGLSYPVVYLLHGLFGSFKNWTELTNIASLPRDEFIIVMPEGENGWYTDGRSGTDNYESYFIRELVPAVDAEYRTIANDRGRGVAGLSMGGYGAFKFALKYPQLFDFAGSVSGAFDAPFWSDESTGPNWDEYAESIGRIFGDAASVTRSENRIDALASAAVETGKARIPFLYFDCGEDDPFIAANKKLAGFFAAASLEHEFQSLAGGHDWTYWNERLPNLLELAGRRLSKPATAKSEQ